MEDKSMTSEQEIEQAKDYLTRLLKTVYPNIYPLSSLLGLISQVDNGFAVPLIKAQKGRNMKLSYVMIRAILWWLFGGCRSYDPPRPKIDGGFLLAEGQPPIWKRLYYKYLWKPKKYRATELNYLQKGGE